MMKERIVFIGVGLVLGAFVLLGINDTVEKLDYMEQVNEELIVKNNNLLDTNNDLLEKQSEYDSKVIELNEKIEELDSELKRVNQTLQNERSKAEEANRGNYTRSTPESNIDTSMGGKTLLGTFEATAYSDNVESQGQWVGQTASGMKPQVGVIAVDPKVIPLGTKLYVEGYGNCVAGDVGGAIKGNRIDVFKNTRDECRVWGRQQVKVYRR